MSRETHTIQNTTVKRIRKPWTSGSFWDSARTEVSYRESAKKAARNIMSMPAPMPLMGL